MYPFGMFCLGRSDAYLLRPAIPRPGAVRRKMRNQITIEEATGKTIEHIICSVTGSVLILLSDNCFLYAKPKHYFSDLEISFTEKFDLLAFGDQELIAAGFATQEEIEAKRERREQARREERAKREREAFERLKAKFEGEGA